MLGNTLEVDLNLETEITGAAVLSRASFNQKNSHVVKTTDLERYVEKAMQSNLLKTQHEAH